MKKFTTYDGRQVMAIAHLTLRVRWAKKAWNLGEELITYIIFLLWQWQTNRVNHFITGKHSRLLTWIILLSYSIGSGSRYDRDFSFICAMNFIALNGYHVCCIISEWVSDCYLTLTQQFVSYIMARTS